ncbi:hypothetical protein [Chitinophaga rhizophila]|uniref:Pentapeptide repeat-containing protein n=1 Tax=Chitinophaga rhizophila TaxID=2866212 RepID=A0ABS7GLA5_9BACT|nr:hypothetical protein [Chitinophaga rhizophila]MBW8687253.1 hypothetical protein [Chitinophaga rhizophila]
MTIQTDQLNDLSIESYNQLFVNRGKFAPEYFPNGPGDLHIKRKKVLFRLTIVDYGVGIGHNPNITFEGCEFTDNVRFNSDTVIKRDIKFINCTFKKDVTFESGEFKKEVQFLGGEIEGVLIVESGKFEKLHIACDAAEVKIEKGNYTDLSIYNPGEYPDPLRSIDNLSIDFKLITGNVRIEGYSIRNLKLTGTVNKDTELLMKEMFFSKIKFENLYCNGKIRIFDLIASARLSPGLEITNSNLGKMDIVNVNLRSVYALSIKSSYLVECTFVNVTWPDSFFNVYENTLESILLDNKETFRQLKYAYSKQGDSVMEHKFHGVELDAYRFYLKAKRREMKPPYNSKFERWKKHRQTSIILLLSKITSNYGQSFAAPLVTILVTGVPLFVLMVAFNKIPPLKLGFNFSLGNISTTVAHWLNFINPLRRYDNQDVNGGLIFDFVMRIISSFCIYNFIRATRRFVK